MTDLEIAAIQFVSARDAVSAAKKLRNAVPCSEGDSECKPCWQCQEPEEYCDGCKHRHALHLEVAPLTKCATSALRKLQRLARKIAP